MADLPPVTGRHRNTALAAARREAAISLVLSGATYQEAADELGYANRGTVHRIVHTAMHQHEVESVEELRALECARLDAIQLAHWDAAVGGDIVAARLVLRVMDHRARLLGLYAANARRHWPYRRRNPRSIRLRTGRIPRSDHGTCENVACPGLPMHRATARPSDHLSQHGSVPAGSPLGGV